MELWNIGKLEDVSKTPTFCFPIFHFSTIPPINNAFVKIDYYVVNVDSYTELTLC